MVFGIGIYEIISMCIRELEKYVNKDFKVFDIGCGSGIFVIVVVKLGVKEVVVVDLDEVVVKVVKENVFENKVEKSVFVMYGNLIDVIKDKVDVIVVNIIVDIIKIFVKDV